MARSYAKRINAGLVLIDKRRPEANRTEVMNIIGDVEGKNVLLIDDLIDTAGTFISAITELKKKGANEIFGSVTHPLLSGQAIEKIRNSEIKTLYVTDSIPLRSECEKIEVRTASELFAEAILRSYNNESISSLFEVDKG